MMRWLQYFVVLFVILDTCTVRGDFGLKIAVSGSSVLEQYALRIRDDCNLIETTSGEIVLDGPSVALNEAAVALKTMFDQIVFYVKPIGLSVATLAADDVGPVETVFNNANKTIVAFAAFINSSAPALLATIQTKVSYNVRLELNNILNSLKTSTADLGSALSALRTGVISARNNNATSTNVSNYVKPSMVSLAQTKTLLVSTDLSAPSFSAVESARTINQANLGIQIGISIESGTMLTEMWEGMLLKDYERINASLQQVTTLVAREVPLVSGQIAQFDSTYSPLTSVLSAKYSEINSVYGNVTNGTADNVLNAYKTLVSSAIGYIKALIESFYPPIKPVITRLAEVLIQRGKNSDFCYESYYPMVEQYLLSGQLSIITCLNTELEREKYLLEALLEINYQLQFFLEDANAYLKTCYRISQFDNPLTSQCLQEHKDFSDLIPCTAIKEYATMLQLLCKEVDSLLFRLWSCVSRDTIRFPLEAKDILVQVNMCALFGTT
ncbi:uncharacterized protein LOC120904250 [Anopheles arabiensis]|uniref:Uncharacterized protein n=1 Tax=Anopheles arabiensis TaxID=7173 RepID=A0A182HQ60_ANOAR|nr:uncharacterized protein LOC120904250 [Anopheles arabiensis]